MDIYTDTNLGPRSLRDDHDGAQSGSWPERPYVCAQSPNVAQAGLRDQNPLAPFSTGSTDVGHDWEDLN